MHILLIEPYYGGSHKSWADSYQRHSKHHVDILTLPAQFWKWRMQGGAVTIARMILERKIQPDLILVSDMINLATLRTLTQHSLANVPFALYMHESQLTYPQNQRQKHGWRYGFINYISALAADHVFFNSQYHFDIFFATVPNMLKHFGDYNELQSIDKVRAKSTVLPLGIDLQRFDKHRTKREALPDKPIILWNHRWEEEKNPQSFFKALYNLQKQGIGFKVALIGENIHHKAPKFEAAKKRLKKH